MNKQLRMPLPFSFTLVFYNWYSVTLNSDCNNIVIIEGVKAEPFLSNFT